ncbi:hypothetical protein [Thalassobacillus devorans]|uniref:hypothetical protein n=1 Tax=Thalassobacillus devorans TaxID=279813 RepID=UPI00048AB66F|nr:hypothetical protein [Thalassobacillus devorans]
MKKITIYMLGTILLLLAAGCAKAEEDKAIIKHKTPSKHQETFQELSLGKLREFELQYPKDENTDTEIWIDYYINGNKQSNPTSLTIRTVDADNEKASLGMGLIRYQEKEPILFLYGPNQSIKDKRSKEEMWGKLQISGWQQHPGEKGITLETNKEVVITAYAGTTSNETRMYDLSKKEELKKLINTHEVVLLLKAKLTTLESE